MFFFQKFYEKVPVFFSAVLSRQQSASNKVLFHCQQIWPLHEIAVVVECRFLRFAVVALSPRSLVYEDTLLYV